MTENKFNKKTLKKYTNIERLEDINESDTIMLNNPDKLPEILIDKKNKTIKNKEVSNKDKKTIRESNLLNNFNNNTNTNINLYEHVF